MCRELPEGTIRTRAAGATVGCLADIETFDRRLVRDRFATEINSNNLIAYHQRGINQIFPKAMIPQEVSENRPFLATTFSRPFKDPSGAWRNVTPHSGSMRSMR